MTGAKQMRFSKQERHNKIIELIRDSEIETQEELCELLNKSGYNITQATISRDIRELKLIKANGAIDAGRQKYAVMLTQEETGVTEKSMRILRDGIISMKCVQNILVIKTLGGLAMGVAASVDALDEPDIIGTIAGDDTIFCIVQNNKRGVMLIKKFDAIING